MISVRGVYKCNNYGLFLLSSLHLISFLASDIKPRIISLFLPDA